MMISTVGSGALMSLVHLCSKVIPSDEYAALGVLIQTLNWLTIPVLGLQMVFAQQASEAINELHQRELMGTIRGVVLVIVCFWLLVAVLVFLFCDHCAAALRLSNPTGLWITLVVAFFMLLSPIFKGVMQGRQNFFWLGWVAFFNSMSRLCVAGIVVLVLRGGAAEIMIGALIGAMITLFVGLWQAVDLLIVPGAYCNWRGWLARVIPLTVGFGASQFLFSADLFVVQAYLGANGAAAPYVFGGTLARAIVIFTGPLAAVMFPKIARNAARPESSDVLWWTLAGTVGLSGAAAVGITIGTPAIVRLGSSADNLSIVPLVPMFAWSMVPLAVANVLLNKLMARSQFMVVPFAVVIATCYWIALQWHHTSFRSVIQMLGTFNVIFLIVCVCCTSRRF